MLRNIGRGYTFAPDGGGGGGGGGGAAPWYQGNAAASADLVGVLQQHGWDKLTPVEAALAATKSYQSAHSLVGAPPEQIVRLPKDANSPEWGAVWTRLGRPNEAKGYDLSAVKFKDGTTLSEGEQVFIQNTSHALNLPKGVGERLAAEMVKYRDGVAEESTRTRAASLAAEKDTLAKNWGGNFNANMEVAKRAIRALGLGEKEAGFVNLIEKEIGYAGVFEMFRNIGARLGEDAFVAGSQGGADKGNLEGVMTREQAIAKRAELMKDAAWVKRYQEGGIAEKREMAELIRIEHGR